MRATGKTAKDLSDFVFIRPDFEFSDFQRPSSADRRVESGFRWIGGLKTVCCAYFVRQLETVCRWPAFS